MLLFFCVANYNMWECACHKKSVAPLACHSLYSQSVLSMTLSIQAGSFPPRIWQVTHLSSNQIKAALHYVRDNKNNPSLEVKQHPSVSPVSTHWNTWLIWNCCSTSNIITLLPTLVSMETSFQSWLIPGRCESAHTKKGGGARVSLCSSMSRRTLWALCSPHTGLITGYRHLCMHMWNRNIRINISVFVIRLSLAAGLIFPHLFIWEHRSFIHNEWISLGPVVLVPIFMHIKCNFPFISFVQTDKTTSYDRVKVHCFTDFIATIDSTFDIFAQRKHHPLMSHWGCRGQN